jgi:hypothetical protein
MDTTAKVRNTGQVHRNILFKGSSSARPVRTISQMNFDVSECRKFLPPGVKIVIEMEHTNDQLR